ASVRPTYQPFPQAPADTVAADGIIALEEAAERIVARGFTLRVHAPREGFLETHWFDLVARKRATVASDPNPPVRLRLFADPATPTSTKLTIETVYRRTLDPSLPEREAELMVPVGSPGDTLARNLLAEVKKLHKPPPT